MTQQEILEKAPTTRYQGSKRRLLPWIYENVRHLKFQTVLDGFGGTGSVSYLFKLMGKQVTFNDILVSNYQSGIALIENDYLKLEESDIEFITYRNGFKYPDFIRRTFKDVYYLDHENRWLDVVALNIKMLSEKYKGRVLRIKQALAYHILFQACLCKRPFNLFHRKNLYLRTARVKRSFGNLKTWNRRFRDLLLRFYEEISDKIVSNDRQNEAMCTDVMQLKRTSFDLVYLDPPYARLDDQRPKDYRSLYHFFEGLVRYDDWKQELDWNTNNRCLLRKESEWEKNSLEENFCRLFRKFQDSTIVVSYGEPGYPPVRTIRNVLAQYKRRVSIVKREQKYSLNQNNGSEMHEVLMIGE